MDTIFAPATARGRAGIAVIRISGPDAHVAAGALCGTLPAIRQAALRRLVWDGVQIDEGLVILFQAGESFTGEAVVELHLHGGIAVVAAALSALSAQPGLRLAEPGEFTRRALENGCLDLTQVEGLAALIDAETEAQRKQALRVLSGAVGRRVEQWRVKLIRAAALLEATIDFVDEDVPVDVGPEVIALLTRLIGDLNAEVRGTLMAERIRNGFEVAIVGKPNAGKSTLLNALAGREAAITSAVAGTTRDVIEVRMDLRGIPVTLLDTAGLRETQDVLETLGIERAVQRANAADLRVFLVLDTIPEGITHQSNDLIVYGKADLRTSLPYGQAVSGVTGEGIAALLGKIGEILSHRASDAAVLTHSRHRAAVVDTIGALEASINELYHGKSRTELAAENLRRGLRALDCLVGRVDAEILLDEIFASFCIGK